MSKTRGQNEGNIKKRSDGRWEARVSLPDGTRKSLYGKSRQEVANLLKDAMIDIKKGLPIVDDSQTIEHYCTSWLETVKYSVKPKTWKYYHDFMRLHVIPVLGKVKMSKLTPQHVQQLYTKKLKEGLSSSTVNHLHSVLHNALNSAVRLGITQRNVTDMIDPPRMNHHEIVTLTEQQAQLLLVTVNGERLEALYVLALSTGMRQGELLALRWQDIDLENGALQVRATLQSIHGELTLTEPKTFGSRRRIALSRSTMRILRQHRERQDEERDMLGSEWDATLDLVFPNSIGKLINPANLMHRNFYPLLKKAALPRIRFHDLRHTAATLLILRGINIKVVSEMLGHSDVTTTMRIYTHVLPHMQEAAASMMDIVLWEKEVE